MKLEKVNSSAIKEVGHLQTSSGSILRVKFKSNHTYDYQGVSKQVFDKLKSAPSVGHYFSENIKNKYVYNKID